MSNPDSQGRVAGEEIVAGVLFVALFVLGSLLANHYATELQSSSMLMSSWGMAQYVAITVAAVVLAPISTVPLIPTATMLWGGFWSAVLSILGWTIGAQIAFELSLRARPFVKRLVPLHKVERYARALMGKRVFVTLLVLRMCVPVDVLSYAVGLFVPISRFKYFLATLLGVAPFAFVFAYASELPMLYQVVTLIGAGLVALVGVWRVTRLATVTSLDARQTKK